MIQNWMHECVTPDVLFLSESGPVSVWDHSPLVRYNLITKRVITTKCLLYSFLRYLSVVFFFCLILCIRFVFGIFARFKPKKSHARRSRTIIVRPFAFPFSASVSRASSYTHIYLVYTSPKFAAIHTHVCVCIFMYINRRCEALTAIPIVEPIKIVLSR